MPKDPLQRMVNGVFYANVGRREFIRRMGIATAVAAGFPTFSQVVRAQNGEDPSDIISGKSDELIVHNAQTGVLETPLELLREHDETPAEIMFIRNNQILEPQGRSLEPAALEDWTVEFMGVVQRPVIINARDLQNMEQREVEMVMQCSGNGRSFYSPRASGSQWQHGGMANVRFSGVPLSALIEELELGIHENVRYITAEGRDDPPPDAARPDFEKSVPYRDVLDKAILAIEMNGEPLPGAHGGPVRLIIPGYYGNMNVKWLGRLRFETHETYNINQVPRYRLPNEPIEPGSDFTFTLENSTPSWHQRIKSVVFSPLEGDAIDGNTVEVRGVTWNDGSVGITSVQVSSDGGQTWQNAQLEAPDSPYAWHHWSAELELESGEQEIWVRAIDALGRAQPVDGDILWNPSGYEWHGMERIAVQVS